MTNDPTITAAIAHHLNSILPDPYHTTTHHTPTNDLYIAIYKTESKYYIAPDHHNDRDYPTNTRQITILHIYITGTDLTWAGTDQHGPTETHIDLNHPGSINTLTQALAHRLGIQLAP